MLEASGGCPVVFTEGAAVAYGYIYIVYIYIHMHMHIYIYIMYYIIDDNIINDFISTIIYK